MKKYVKQKLLLEHDVNFLENNKKNLKHKKNY